MLGIDHQHGRLRSGEAEANPGVPGQWGSAIRRAMARDCAKRYTIAGEQGNKLDRLLVRYVHTTLYHGLTRHRGYAIWQSHRLPARRTCTTSVWMETILRTSAFCSANESNWIGTHHYDARRKSWPPTAVRGEPRVPT